ERWQGVPAGMTAGRVNPLVRDALTGFAGRAEVAHAYGELVRRVYEQSKLANAADAPDADARRQLLELVTGPEAPGRFPKSHTSYYMSRKEKDEFAKQQSDLDKLAANAATPPPPRAMVLADAEWPWEPRVFVRGNPGRPGERVPRR